MLWSALLIGLAGSLHCVGMCGPIALLLPLDRANSLKATFQVALYHTGRIVTYGFMGLLFGVFGRGLHLSGLQQSLSIWLGILFLTYFIFRYLIRIKVPANHQYNRFLMKLQAAMAPFFRSKKPGATFVMGLLNGWLPCGMVYMALFGALATGVPLQGMLYMMLFGVGTIPLLSVLTWLGTQKLFFKIRWQRVLPAFILLMGVFFLLRGLGLGIPFLSPETTHLHIKALADCGFSH